MIVLNNISKEYPNFKLEDINLELKDGEMVLEKQHY